MNTATQRTRPAGYGRMLLLAGFAGGLAEVVWVGLYCALTPLTGQDVMREVALAVGGGAIDPSWQPAAGLAVHFGLAIALAAVFGAALASLLERGMPVGAVVPLAAVTLVAVWANNFFVVLPAIAPGFVELMPLAVTAASKVLFGLSMGAVLYRGMTRTSRARAIGIGGRTSA